MPVTLVTGSSRGLGWYLAEHLAGRGHRVIGCSRSTPTWTHPGCEHVGADVTQEPAVIDLLRRIRENHGGLDAVICNAGIGSMNPVLLMPLAGAEALVRTHFLGTFLVAREAAKLMMRARTGRIITVSSVAVPLALEGEAVYAAAKAAVETFTRIFAREVAPYGITVNAIGPSPIQTDLIRGVPKEKLDALVERLAIKRFGTPADVANVVDFFLRPESDYITGQVVYLGGAG